MAPTKFFKINLIVILCLGIFLFTQYRSLLNRYILSDDVMQVTYWMNKYHDRELFQGDIYVEYARYLRPEGIKLIYYLITFFTDPISGGKILSLSLFLIACYLLLTLLSSLYYKSSELTLLALFFVTNSAVLKTFPGGVGRSFSYPILLLFLIGILRKDSKLSGIAIISGVLFYPLLFPLMMVTLTVYPLISFLIQKEFPKIKKNGYLFTALIISGAILIFKISTQPEFLGPLISKKEMLSNPFFYPGGRSNYFPFRPYLYYLFKYFCQNILELLILTIGTWELFKRNKNYFTLFLTLFLVSPLLYSLAKIFFIRLYLPERYPLYLLSLLRTILLSGGIIYIGKILKKKPLSYLGPIFIFIAIYSSSENKIKPGVGLISIRPEAREITEFIRSKSKNIFVIAPPYLGDYISTFSERKVLLKYELTQGWFKNYYKLISKRTLDFFKAYYSNNLQEIKKLIKKYNADYIIVDLKYFEPDFLNSEKIYIEPFNSQILNFLPQDRNFAVLNLLQKAEFKNKRYYIIPTSILN